MLPPCIRNVVLCQHIIVGRDSEIARTDGLLMVRGNSDSRPHRRQFKHIITRLSLVGGLSKPDFLLSERALLATSDERSRAKLAPTRKNLAFSLSLHLWELRFPPLSSPSIST